MGDRRSARGFGEPLQVFVAVVVAASFAGFFLGTRSTRADFDSSAAHSPLPAVQADCEGCEAVPASRPYFALRKNPVHPAPSWPEAAPHLRDAARAVRDERTLAGVLQDRSGRRAYDGAPPVIPHPVEQRSAASCLSCHAEAMSIGGRVAPVMSHRHYSSCTQCHAEERGSMPPGDPLREDARYEGNRFAGQPAPSSGPRAWAIAPPQVPHKTFMRETCLSCHGDAGAAPMRTSHPDRQSCLQCHAPSARLDQHQQAEELQVGAR